jgi:hypothetical protein
LLFTDWRVTQVDASARTATHAREILHSRRRRHVVAVMHSVRRQHCVDVGHHRHVLVVACVSNRAQTVIALLRLRRWWCLRVEAHSFDKRHVASSCPRLAANYPLHTFVSIRRASVTTLRLHRCRRHPLKVVVHEHLASTRMTINPHRVVLLLLLVVVVALVQHSLRRRVERPLPEAFVRSNTLWLARVVTRRHTRARRAG